MEALIPQDWKSKKLQDVCRMYSGTTPSRSDAKNFSGKNVWVSSGELKEKYIHSSKELISDEAILNTALSVLQPGTVIIAIYGLEASGIRGTASITAIPCTISQACMAFYDFESSVYNEYFYYWYIFNGPIIGRRYAQGTKQQNLSSEILSSFPICLPPIAEQRKIAEILSAQDRVIELKTKLLKEKKRLKKYLCQTLLSGKRRFPSYHEPWNKVCLSSILKEKTINCKNQNLRVYSVSVDVGVVDQIEHLGRSYAARDISKYTVVEKGDVIYTKSPTGLFPFGIVKQSQMDASGAVSPLYAVYSPKSIELGYLLHTYFSYPLNTTNYLKSLIQRGPKNTVSISNSDFLKKALHLPVDKDEIARLSDLFKQIDTEIRIMANNIEQENLKKKALMQQLLTGKIRVTV